MRKDRNLPAGSTSFFRKSRYPCMACRVAAMRAVKACFSAALSPDFCTESARAGPKYALSARHLLQGQLGVLLGRSADVGPGSGVVFGRVADFVGDVAQAPV